MTEKNAQQVKTIFGGAFLRGRGISAVVFAALFFLGYIATAAVVQTADAQVTAAATPPNVTNTTCSNNWSTTCVTTCDAFGVCTDTCTTVCLLGGYCEDPGTASDEKDRLVSSLRNDLENAATSLEAWLDKQITRMLQEELEQLENIEQWSISWWQTMWNYNLLPGLQSMARQLNIDLALQAFTLQSNADAVNEMETIHALQKHGIEDQMNLRPGEQVCVAGTVAGGYGRVTAISRAMRQAWENESVAHGLNKVGDIGAAAGVYTEAQRYDDLRNIFCDPDGNGGRNNCGATLPAFYNADVQPTKFFYDNLTIDVNKDPRTAKAVETIINNMVGVPSADPILKAALSSPPGQEVFLDRRSYLARYAAIRSVPEMVAGWRMPGSKMGDWVRDLRMSAGVPDVPGAISDNPSYKEIMHAVSVDRFNSGKYAAGMITDENKIEMEKLTLNTLYLMQLRDYYELLERTALTLAVQVSMLSGQEPLPNVRRARPLKGGP